MLKKEQRKNNLEEIRFRVRKGEKAKITAFASAKGMRLATYIKDLIRKDMEGLS